MRGAFGWCAPKPSGRPHSQSQCLCASPSPSLMTTTSCVCLSTGFLQLEQRFLGHGLLPRERRAAAPPLATLPEGLAKVAVLLWAVLTAPLNRLLAWLQRAQQG